ncbi:MAG: type I polyketide synthase, partial [Cyanobacteria bacterium J06555_13]
MQTGCSTSLVAIHTACQSLLQHECDIALAGGVTISNATPQGYTYQAESIASPDGHCRAFDQQGQGTVFGNGVGIVVLKRLQAAVLDGDHIYAVIKGSAVNNDGADKVNLIAPSISGQAAAIRSALENAGVDPHTISYVEAHGTGTPLGDPIEVAALNKVFSADSSTTDSPITPSHHCALGSVKTNLGHLDAAAGDSGFIKTVLALQHKTLPASLNYTQPNAKIDFQNGFFVVNRQRTHWTESTSKLGSIRRAGVSSFGMGGTNAHAILEEAPERCPASPARPWQLVTLSAKTPTALDTATQNLAAYLQNHPEVAIADIAYTLQIGRRDWTHRRVCLCQTTTDAIVKLRGFASEQEGNNQSDRIGNNEALSAVTTTTEKSVVFMFSGQGSQHIDMAKDLYEVEPTFRQTIDHCAEILGDDLPLLDLLYPNQKKQQPITPQQQSASSPAPHSPTLNQTTYAQPALFAIEYALAKLWLSWGIQPKALIGHSIGEYVAACIAGIVSLEDALFLVTQRGQLMQRCQPGSMLSVLAGPETLKMQLSADTEIAVINGPKNCVVSGPTPAIEALERQLEKQDMPCRLLATSHAFHSAMMESALEDFTKALQKV